MNILKCYIRKAAIGVLCVLLNFIVVNFLIAQEKTGQQSFTLQVVDENGQGLEDAIVISFGNQRLGKTDKEGKVELNIKSGEKVKLQLKGFYDKVVQPSNRGAVRMIKRYLASSEAKEVLYDQKENYEILGAVSSVNSNQISSTPTALYLNALTGRLPGFYTEQYNGFRNARTEPITKMDLAGSLPNSAVKYSSNLSDNSEIGYSLRGQAPVTIIDGVQRDIYSIDPENIESITVLKDALSSLLLGQKSSRGVLQITTKKGKAGPPRISFSAQSGFQEALNKPKPLNAYQYAYLYNEALQNSGRAPAYTEEDFNLFRNGTSPTLYPNVNWYDEVYKDKAPISKFNLAVDGGLKNARYAIAVSYFNQEGLFKSLDNLDYKTNLETNRYLINSTVDVDVTKNFNIGLQLFGRVQDGRQPGAGTNAILNNLFATPNNAYPILNPDGSYGGSSVYSTNLYQQVTGSGYLLDNTRDLMANLDLKYRFDNWLPGLYAKFKTNVSATSSSLINRSKNQPVYDASEGPSGKINYTRYGLISDQPNSFSTTSTANFFYAQASLGYDKIIATQHNVGVKLFTDQQIANFQFDLPAKYTNLAISANYNYKAKYFTEAALNYSGFSRFQPGNRFGLFYAFGLGWDIAKESFVSDNLDWLNQLKLRATFGKTGNTNEGSLGYYSWRSDYGQDGTNGYNVGSGYSFVSGIKENRLANVNATWEKAHKLNVGVDLGLFNSHLLLTADFYRDKYYDLLQQRGSTVELIGLDYPNENIGENLFSGQELTVTYQNNINSFNYFVTVNASRMKTEVLYMDELQQKYKWNYRTGMPVGQTFGYLSNGLIQTQEEADKAPLLAGTKVYPGDVKLLDLNNDGIINLYDQAPLGNTKPIIFYGTSLGFNIKGFDFSVLLQGVKNRTYQQTDYAFGQGGDRQGYDYLIGRWTPENAQNASYPRLTLGFNANNTPYLNNASYWTRSGEYFRVRNINVGYTLPYHISNKFKVSSLRIFAGGQNLFTSTPYSRLDPEVHGNTAYPLQRVFNAGINIKL